jgi:hypothetical protein
MRMTHLVAWRLAAPFFLLAVGCSSGPLESSDLEMSAGPVVDGMLAAACQWPTAVTIHTCTATLVHPKVVTLAAHCLEGVDFPNEVLFGEDESRPARRVPVETCKAYPDFVLGRSDIAYCTLASEVLDVPATPIIMGCETDYLKTGNSLTLVGFGHTSAKEGGTTGQKRWAEVTIRRAGSTGQSIEVGMGTATSCAGDSGGPLYAKLSDGTFRAVGAASLTRLVDDECVPPAIYTLLYKFVGWMETDSGLDLTPCHDADGTWNPGRACGGFATAADRSNGAWIEGCHAGATSGVGAMCGQGVDAGFDANAPLSDTGTRDMAFDDGGNSMPRGDRDAVGATGSAAGDAPASVGAGLDGAFGSSDGAPGPLGSSAGGLGDPASCACRVVPSTISGAREAWFSMWALGSVGVLRKRRRTGPSRTMPLRP